MKTGWFICRSLTNLMVIQYSSRATSGYTVVVVLSFKECFDSCVEKYFLLKFVKSWDLHVPWNVFDCESKRSQFKDRVKRSPVFAGFSHVKFSMRMTWGTWSMDVTHEREARVWLILCLNKRSVNEIKAISWSINVKAIEYRILINFFSPIMFSGETEDSKHSLPQGTSRFTILCRLSQWSNTFWAMACCVQFNNGLSKTTSS